MLGRVLVGENSVRDPRSGIETVGEDWPTDPSPLAASSAMMSLALPQLVEERGSISTLMWTDGGSPPSAVV